MAKIERYEAAMERVSDADAESLVNNLLYLYRCIGYGDTKRGLFAAFEEKRAEIVALLTAHPEPGTHDAATEGGKP